MNAYFDPTRRCVLLSRDLSSTIASRLTEIRSLRGETLDSLSAKSGVSKGMISRVERKEVGVSVETLSKISEALGVSISDLLKLDERKKLIICAPEQQPVIDDTKRGFVRRTLSPTFESRSIEFVHNTLEPRSETPIFPAHRSGVEEYIYVLQGTLTGVLGNQKVEIRQGECLYYDATITHSFKNNTDQTVIWILVINLAGPGLKS